MGAHEYQFPRQKLHNNLFDLETFLGRGEIGPRKEPYRERGGVGRR